jgi:hypothetical protein
MQLQGMREAQQLLLLLLLLLPVQLPLPLVIWVLRVVGQGAAQPLLVVWPMLVMWWMPSVMRC